MLQLSNELRFLINVQMKTTLCSNVIVVWQKCLVSHCGRKVHLKGTSGRESESLDDDRVSSFDCEGLAIAIAGALSVAGLPVLEVEGVESAVVFATFDGIAWVASVVFLFFTDERGPDS